MKWRVWVGHQLARWRASARDEAGREHFMLQKVAVIMTGISADRLSFLESGDRGVEPSELRALATAYGRTPEDVGALFAPPSPTVWKAEVVKYRVKDERFMTPPRDQTASRR